MGYIYKITNTINNKIYIGKTERDIQTRWEEHLRNINKPSVEHLPIYRAFRKYGIENFTIEEIEEVLENDLLDTREIYWIQYYQSYGKQGYNCNGGGEGGIKSEWEGIDEIIERYNNGERLDKLCKEYHHSYGKIRPFLIERGLEINTQAGPQKVSRSIKSIDDAGNEIIYVSLLQAATELSKSIGNTIRGSYTGISRSLNKDKKYKNLYWKDNN